MTGFFADDLAGTIGTWVAAAITLGVWAYLVGERRIFRYAQHLLAGLLTGYVVVLSVRDVMVPRLAEPLASDTAQNLVLLPAGALAVVLVAARYLPRQVVAVPVSVLVAATAAFALGGAVAGTLLPQLAGAMLPAPDEPDGLAAIVGGILSLGIIALVLLSFRHGVSTGGLVGRAGIAGRWLLVAGLGGWFGFMLLGRLVLVVERAGFLVLDWLKIGG